MKHDTSSEALNVCYYPTSVLFVDDYQPFLDSLPLQLETNLAYKLFNKPLEAVEYINSNIIANPLRSENCLIADNNEYFSPSVTLDIEAIQNRVKDTNRFLEPSVLVVDYDMPNHDGLNICARIKDPHLKKVLLTGVADDQIAIDALNDKKIDYFLKKSDPKLFQKLNALIPTLQMQYFSQYSNVARENLNTYTPQFHDKAFILYFNQLCQTKNIVEYYFQDEPAGFFLASENGKVYQLLVYTEELVSAHICTAQDYQAPDELVKEIENRQKIPLFPSDSGYYDETPIGDWQQYFHPAEEITGQVNYYAALLEQSEQQLSFAQGMHSYQSFLDELNP